MKGILCFTALFSTIAIVLFSCIKAQGGAGQADDPNVIDLNDDVFPVIAITSPSPSQVYASGDSIVVEGKVTDNKLMYKGKVQIKNDAISVIVAENFYETHFLPAISFRLAYRAIVTTPTDFSVLVEFQDHGANTADTTIKVKVNP